MTLETRSPGILRFGTFEVDVRAGELRKHGRRIKLQDQPFQVLALLLQRRGDVVTRGELRLHIWREDIFVDFDNGLNTAINKLRAALGDSAEAPRYVETLAKRGYRFIAATDGARAAIAVNPPPIDSIAVFPLEMGNPDPDTEYLAIGIPGGIIHSLSRIPNLRVVSWRAAASQENRQADSLAIGRNLGVRAVLMGRIWRRGSKLRLHMDMLDPLNGEEIWGEQYDRELRQLFDIQDEISREVSENIGSSISPADGSAVPWQGQD